MTRNLTNRIGYRNQVRTPYTGYALKLSSLKREMQLCYRPHDQRIFLHAALQYCVIANEVERQARRGPCAAEEVNRFPDRGNWFTYQAALLLRSRYNNAKWELTLLAARICIQLGSRPAVVGYTQDASYRDRRNFFIQGIKSDLAENNWSLPSTVGK
jgi:hypothetical protein